MIRALLFASVLLLPSVAGVQVPSNSKLDHINNILDKELDLVAQYHPSGLGEGHSALRFARKEEEEVEASAPDTAPAPSASPAEHNNAAEARKRFLDRQHPPLLSRQNLGGIAADTGPGADPCAENTTHHRGDGGAVEDPKIEQTVRASLGCYTCSLWLYVCE